MPNEIKRKQELVARINNLFIRQGIYRFSMASLAKHLDISRGKLYMYFANKDEVISDVVDRYVNFAKAMRQDPNRDWSLDALPTWLLDAMLLIGATSPVFLTQLQQQYPDLRQQMETSVDRWEDNFTAYLRDGMRRGNIHKIDAPIFLGLIRSSVATMNAPTFMAQSGRTSGQAIGALLAILLYALVDDNAAEPLMTAETTQAHVADLAEKFDALYRS